MVLLFQRVHLSFHQLSSGCFIWFEGVHWDPGEDFPWVGRGGKASRSVLFAYSRVLASRVLLSTFLGAFFMVWGVLYWAGDALLWRWIVFLFLWFAGLWLSFLFTVFFNFVLGVLSFHSDCLGLTVGWWFF